jgi:hypothetical protein
MTDQDGNSLMRGISSGPTHGTLTLNPTATFTYTPAGELQRPDSFTYKANDGTADRNRHVSLTSMRGTMRRSGQNDTTAPMMTRRCVAAPGVLGNDTDVDGERASAVKLPVRHTAS